MGGTPGPSMSCIVACMSQCLNMCEMVPDSNSHFITRNRPSGAITVSALIAPQGVLFTCQYSSYLLSSHCDQTPWSFFLMTTAMHGLSQIPLHLSMHTATPDTAIRIVTRLWAGRSGVQGPVDERDFSLLQSQLALGYTQPPLQRVPGSLPRVMRPGPKVDHSTPSSTEVKNEWNYSYIPPIRLNGVYRGHFTLYTFSFAFYVTLRTDTYRTSSLQMAFCLCIRPCVNGWDQTAYFSNTKPARQSRGYREGRRADNIQS